MALEMLLSRLHLCPTALRGHTAGTTYQQAAVQLAGALQQHATRVCLQTMHSADARDAEKLSLNLTGFIGKIEDADGIVQQVKVSLPLEHIPSLTKAPSPATFTWQDYG